MSLFMAAVLICVFWIRDLVAVIVFIYWISAVFGRMTVKHAVDDTRAASDHEEDSRIDEVHSIFLSHSGQQKAFVEKLYDALRSANHVAFFDKHALPKGCRFPSRIFRAMDGCKLGVVVLSDDFLTSKWPMLELERLVLQKRTKDPETIMLPLFYKLHPQDLRSRENLFKWRCAWKEKGGQHANAWEQAVRALNSINGEVFAQGTSEAAYIKRVVRHICDHVPSPILYDLSHVRGHDRFAQEVALQFGEQCDKVCMVGLYGVGGLGKTTICKIMCNFYNSHLYPGKSCHIEFPSDGDDKKIVQECTKALKKLANLSDEHLLNKADSIDQVIQLMKQNLRQYDVFLAIDNVWESSLEAAKRILGVSFSDNSKILLTSRSEEVLKDLLGRLSNTTVGPLPSPDQQEGFQIFQHALELDDRISLLVNRNLLDSVLRRCFFSGKYHALALKALGKYVKRVCALEGLGKIEQILKEIDNSTALQNVEDLIQLNYLNLAEEKKHMFLDIVVVVMADASSDNVEVTYEKAHQWLSFLYKMYPKNTITNLIYELALDGLIQLENIDDRSAEKMIRVHDLYFDLAKREAATSARFFTDGSTTSLEEIEWERLERVMLREHPDGSRFMEDIQQQECRKLQVLCAENIGFMYHWGIQLDLMPSLCVLKLERGYLGSIEDWSAAKGLAIVHLSDLECVPPLKPIPSIPCLEELIIQDVKTVEGPPNIDGGQHLKTLALLEESVFMKGEESNWEVSYFNSLMNLESLKIQHFNSSITRGVLNLNALVNLKLLEVGSCKSIKRIEGLDALKNLQSLVVEQCQDLSNLDGLSGLTCLERLVLRDNKSMKEVVAGRLSPALKSVEVYRCEKLKTMPDLSGLTCLERLTLEDNKSMKEVVGGLSPALKDVEVRWCENLKTMPDLSGLTCLKTLWLLENESMEEVGGENLSSTLDRLCVSRCRSLQRFPSLNECVHLRELKASACFINNKNIGSFIEINLPNLQRLWLVHGERTSIKRLISGSFLENLQDLHVIESAGEWTSFERLIRGVAHLQRLTIIRCDSLVKLEVGSLPSNLKYLEVCQCKALEEIEDLSALHSLETLCLSQCPRLEITIPDVSLIPFVSIERCGTPNYFHRM